MASGDEQVNWMRVTTVFKRPVESTSYFLSSKLIPAQGLQRLIPPVNYQRVKTQTRCVDYKQSNLFVKLNRAFQLTVKII